LIFFQKKKEILNFKKIKTKREGFFKNEEQKFFILSFSVSFRFFQKVFFVFALQNAWVRAFFCFAKKMGFAPLLLCKSGLCPGGAQTLAEKKFAPLFLIILNFVDFRTNAEK
jgi:hypothetical protein